MKAVFRIHDILGWIRIRILGSMLLTNAIFVIDLQHASKKLIFNIIFSAYYFLKVHLHLHLKVEKLDPVHITVEIWIRIRIEGDADPQPCLKPL